MKKMCGTRYATIAISAYPKLDALEAQVKEQLARLEALAKELKLR